MAYITRITVQKKLKDRYNIFLDKGRGEEYAFSVSEDVLIKHGLKKGMEIDELDIMEIQYQEDIQKAYTQSIQFLSIRMRSEQEVRQHLKKKEWDAPIIQEVIHKLKKFNYINDLEFAKAYVRTQINTTKKGPQLITKELNEKGVAEDSIQEAIKEYDEHLQIEHARALIEKNKKSSKRISTVEYKRKMEQMLFSKGFPSWVVQEIIVNEPFENDLDEEWESLCYQGVKAHKRYMKYEGFQYEQKMKQALYRKGFSIELIEKFLNEKEEYV
ncbi:recombination regulator RecX [Peribacillus tepidiphilus]|uniref:recombination regulator RecX n=1 Tax=Peribacillus tepidiphilus TaxID=2652445 RepID=UPI0035B56D22